MDNIIKAYAVKNLCYQTGKKMTPAGIVVHSTGANNPYLKRYVDCPGEVGKNAYGNHWNTPTPGGKKVCVHAFIGYDKNKRVRVAEILPLTICCWGVGSGSKGSYNYDPPYIQFEICEDALTDKKYYQEAFGVAAQYCAYICREYGLSVDHVIGHREAYQKGYGSNHSDPEHWMKKFGETMADFRERVSVLLNDNTVASTDKPKAVANKEESSAIGDGTLVSLSKNATYFNGQSIPGWVKSQNWYVRGAVKGDRAVIDKNEKGTHSICSPINVKFLTAVKVGTKASASTPPKSTGSYRVKVTAVPLEIYKGAGIDTGKVGRITSQGVYTIVQECQGVGADLWGKLKSGAGWISLDRVTKV